MTTADTRGAALAQDPTAFFGRSFTQMHDLPRSELEALQLEALQFRFAQQRDVIPVLKKVSDRQGVSEIHRLEDVLPLLFDHTIYKSYPPSFLEQGRFDRLTKWLDSVTRHDLSRVDTSGCEGICDWIDALQAQSPIKLCHSSGTTGVMSFFPYSVQDWHTFGKTLVVGYFQEFGDEAPTKLEQNVACVFPYFRYGASSFLRNNDMNAELIAGKEDRFYALYPGTMDSDVLYLAARIRAAKAKGRIDEVKVSPAVQARQKEFEDLQKQMPDDMEAFFGRVIADLTDQRIFMLAPWSILHDMAQAGAKRGLSKVFASNSAIFTGGGNKGVEPPENWQEDVITFLGVPKLRWLYGMSEMCAANPRCDHGYYHMAPWVVSFVLDPDSGQVLPREGVVTGRYAFIDLLPESRWGGFITGDEVTIHWDEDCPCGARSPRIGSEISRYSEKRGGDDKINCASTADAHQEALDFMSQAAGKGSL